MKINTNVLLIILLTSGFSTGCSQLGDMSSLNSLSNNLPVNVPGGGSVLGKVDISKAAEAAIDLGKAATLSDEEVKQMAMSYAKHSDTKRRLAPPSSSYAKRLSKLTRDHVQEDGLKLNYKVYLDPNINAFAVADGSIRVYSGLMDMMNDDELLFIIGHEIGHVKHGHSASRIKMANATSGLRKGVASTSSVAGALADEEFIGGMIEKVINSQYSQSNETEADEYGVAFMRKNGYKVEAAITSFNKLAALDGKSNFIDGLFASHPTSDDRAQHLAKLIGKDSSVQIASGTKNSGSNNEKSAVSEPNNSTHAGLSPESKNTGSRNYDTGEYKSQSEGSSFSATSSSGYADQRGPQQGWYVQVIASSSRDGANQMKSTLEKYGFSSDEQEAIVRGTKYHRVLVGPYASKQQALQGSQKLQGKATLDEAPFIRYLN
ncbi:MAG TPA: M48 family metalloprotease [Oligoflexia bacterium]|nr:M48 family metalloprotease [Oligoflexia bacterium]